VKKLTGNFLWMAAANAVAALCGIFVYIYLARVLHPAGFGRLAYVQSLVFYLLNFVDLGLTTYGIREVSKDRKRVSEYVSEIVSFRLLIALFLYLAVVALSYLFPQLAEIRALLLETALLFFIAACATEWAFQGIEAMHMVLVSFALTAALQISLVYIAVKGPADILKVPLAQYLAAIPILLIFLRHFRFAFRIKGDDLIRMKRYLSSALVIWGISIFAQVYNGLDIILLGFFRSPEEVGCFTIARRAVGGITLLMVFLVNAALPRLAFTFAGDRAGFTEATRAFLKLTVSAALLILVPAVLFSDKIILLSVGEEYLAADLTMKIMLSSLLLVLINIPYSTGLVAAGMERKVLAQTIGSAAVNVILNVVLMGRYGMVGAAVSFLAAELVALCWILSIYKNKIGFSRTVVI